MESWLLLVFYFIHFWVFLAFYKERVSFLQKNKTEPNNIFLMKAYTMNLKTVLSTGIVCTDSCLLTLFLPLVKTSRG